MGFEVVKPKVMIESSKQDSFERSRNYNKDVI